MINQTYKNYEVIFVDAGSTDGSVEYVRENFPQILIIQCGRIGIGEAINAGIRKSSGDIISFDFNTDEYVFPNWLEELCKLLERYDYNIIVGTTRIIYKTNLIDEAGVNINYLGRGNKLGHRKDIRTFEFKQEPVTYVGSPTFHRKLLDEIGLIDETYFLYSEDLDFCYRANLVGFKTYCAFLARSYHHISGTVGGNIERYEFFLKRSHIRFQVLYFGSIRVIISLAATCIYLPLSSFFRSIIFPKSANFFFRKFMADLRAIKWNIINLRMILLRRRQINLLKKIYQETANNSKKKIPNTKAPLKEC